MNISLIQDKLDQYQCKTAQEEENAIKEIVQEICLAGLSRSDFFKKAAFQGGTCLRILYGLPRFSEDLDFVLKESNQLFQMTSYLKFLKEELDGYGFQFELQDRSKLNNAVKKVFLKDDSSGHLLTFQYQPQQAATTPKKIKIKIEVDTNPPLGADTEEKMLNFPFYFSVSAQGLPSLFAGKSHALLCRTYVKGRDWFDFLWYIRKKIKPNYLFLENALFQLGPWQENRIKIDSKWYHTEMTKKIRSIDWKHVKQDVSFFLKPQEIESLKYWSCDFFLNELKKMPL